jgi:hypothetical protein
MEAVENPHWFVEETMNFLNDNLVAVKTAHGNPAAPGAHIKGDNVGRFQLLCRASLRVEKRSIS